MSAANCTNPGKCMVLQTIVKAPGSPNWHSMRMSAAPTYKTRTAHTYQYYTPAREQLPNRHDARLRQLARFNVHNIHRSGHGSPN